METPINECRKCGGQAKPSTAIMNYHNIQTSDRSKEFETKHQGCLKCAECGHSWIPELKKYVIVEAEHPFLGKTHTWRSSKDFDFDSGLYIVLTADSADECIDYCKKSMIHKGENIKNTRAGRMLDSFLN